MRGQIIMVKHQIVKAGGLIWLGLMVAVSASASSVDLLDQPEAQAFIKKTSSAHGIATDEISELLSQSVLQESILKAMNNQAEAKKWFEYRPIFIQPTRIKGGVEFMAQHHELLTRVEEKLGVPAEIITSIIGVETRYGNFWGSYRILDALVTLGFYYPRRATFFQSELEQFILLTKEERMDPFLLKGSYAGAMGMPQFMPSSYRQYAVDFDEDGRRDLWSSPADITASVANYLSRHGWKKGQPIAVRAKVKGEKWRSIASYKIQRPTESVSSFKKYGVEPASPLAEDLQASFLVLEGSEGPEHWLVMDNFYVITRYNRSSMYAMAVFQLSEAIAQGSKAQ